MTEDNIPCPRCATLEAECLQSQRHISDCHERIAALRKSQNSEMKSPILPTRNAGAMACEHCGATTSGWVDGDTVDMAQLLCARLNADPAS